MKLIKSTLLLCAILLSHSVNGQFLQTVWPGDASNNGGVSNVDVLYVGIGFGSSGPSRGNGSTAWLPDSVAPWQSATGDSTNFGLIDCDGNGTINLDDIDVIDQNYGLHQTPVGLPIDTFNVGSAIDVPLSFNSSSDTVFVSPGGVTTITKNILLGTQSNPVNSFFGIAFSINYDPGQITAQSIILSVPQNSWIGPNVGGRSPIFYTREDSINGRIDVALSLKALDAGVVSNSISGFGDILTMAVPIEDDLILSAVEVDVTLNIDNVRLIDKRSMETLVATEPYTLKLINSSTGINQNRLSKEGLARLYPNPANSRVNIKVDELTIQSISVYSAIGKLTHVESFHLNSISETSIDISKMPSGVYVVSIQTNEGIISKRLLIER